MPILASDDFNQPIQALKPASPQAIAYTATSAQSLAVSATCEVVRLVSTTDCFFDIGTNPVAAATKFFLPAGMPECIRIEPGFKIAAAQSTAAGTLYIAEMV